MGNKNSVPDLVLKQDAELIVPRINSGLDDLNEFYGYTWAKVTKVSLETIGLSGATNVDQRLLVSRGSELYRELKKFSPNCLVNGNPTQLEKKKIKLVYLEKEVQKNKKELFLCAAYLDNVWRYDEEWVKKETVMKFLEKCGVEYV